MAWTSTRWLEVKLRVEGTEQEISEGVALLALVFDLHEVSKFYPNRGRSVLGRVYVTAVPRTVTRADAERTDTRNRPPFGEIGSSNHGEITR
jgi:hypothetical protein